MPPHWAGPKKKCLNMGLLFGLKKYLCIEDHVDALVNNVFGMVAKEF